jgi:pimeloyl-ACP methyl ester carboxylesterase
MKTIILPGYSPRNKDWALEVKKNLSGEALAHDWEHWKGGSMSVKKELERIIRETGTDSLNIIAKSVGTRVAMNFLSRKTNRVEKIILCGIPTVSSENAELFRKALEGFPPENIVVFQNTKDTFATFKEVKEFMAKVNPEIKVRQMPASTHDYPYFSDFESFLK